MSIAALTPPRIDAGPNTFRMLVCLDCSPSSEVCLPYAISLARTFDSEITLVHVMQPRNGHGGPHTTDALGGRSHGKSKQRRTAASDPPRAASPPHVVGVYPPARYAISTLSNMSFDLWSCAERSFATTGRIGPPARSLSARCGAVTSERVCRGAALLDPRWQLHRHHGV